MSTNPVLRKKGAAGVRTWLALDSTGQTQVVEAGRYSIMRRTGLPGRDLRVLDPLLSYPSTVLGRERAIVVNLEHVKAIVMAKEVLLLNSMDPFVSPFVEELRRRILGHHRASKTREGNVDDSNNRVLFETEEKQSNESLNRRGKRGSSQLQDEDESMINKAEAKHALKQQDGYQILPFEFVALEACLEAACSALENEAKGLELEAYPALDKLTSQISTLNLERVRQMKSRLVAITGRVQKVRDELEHLLDDDNDMAEMYLSDKLLQNNLEEEDSSTSNDEDDDDMHDETADTDNRIVPPEIVMEIQRGSSASKENNNGNDGSVLDRVYSARNTLSRDSHIGSSRRSNPIKHKVAELEMLLEAYFVQIDGTLNKLSTVREYVDDTEDYINITLDDKQNQLLQMGVMLTTATMVSTIFIVVTGLLGMNIRNALFLTDTPTGMPRWLWTTGAGCTGIVILYVMAIAWYKYKGYID